MIHIERSSSSPYELISHCNQELANRTYLLQTFSNIF